MCNGIAIPQPTFPPYLQCRQICFEDIHCNAFLSAIDKTIMPPPVEYTVEWCCPQTYLNKPISDSHRDFIELSAARTVKYWARITESTTVRIRKGVHSDTKKTTISEYGNREVTMIQDEGGPHYTAEYRDPGNDKWSTFHYYVIVKGGGATLITNNSPKCDPNPKLYGRPGKSISEGREPERTEVFSSDEI